LKAGETVAEERETMLEPLRIPVAPAPAGGGARMNEEVEERMVESMRPPGGRSIPAAAMSAMHRFSIEFDLILNLS
jgi:hypothetical protein